jgi:hypothetical protein
MRIPEAVPGTTYLSHSDDNGAKRGLCSDQFEQVFCNPLRFGVPISTRQVSADENFTQGLADPRTFCRLREHASFHRHNGLDLRRATEIVLTNTKRGGDGSGDDNAKSIKCRVPRTFGSIMVRSRFQLTFQALFTELVRI